MKNNTNIAIGAILSLMVLTVACGKNQSETVNKTQPNRIIVPTTIDGWHPGHYVLLNDGDPINTSTIPIGFRGAQRKYLWKDIESTQGNYDFSRILADLNAISTMDQKYLVVQIQTKAFGVGVTAVPDYVKNHVPSPNKYKWVYTTSTGSLDPVVWDDEVSARIKALYTALGNALKYKTRGEAVVIPESALSSNIEAYPQLGVKPYTSVAHYQGLNEQMNTLRSVLSNKVINQYTNFPINILANLVANEETNGIGLGGPDISASSPGLNGPGGAYSFYTASRATHIPFGAAVQYPDYIDPSYASVQSIYNFGKTNLNLHYIFWQNRGGGYFASVAALVADLTGTDPVGGLNANKPDCYTP